MRPSFWHYLHIVVQFSIACGGQSSVLARCGLTRRTFSPSRRTTWGQYYIVVEASMVGGRLFSTCTVHLPTDHALPCPRIVAMCARPDCPCASWARRQVGISSTDICSGLVEARRGATGRQRHGEQQCGWDLSCHLTFTHLHSCLSLMLSARSAVTVIQGGSLSPFLTLRRRRKFAAQRKILGAFHVIIYRFRVLVVHGDHLTK